MQNTCPEPGTPGFEPGGRPSLTMRQTFALLMQIRLSWSFGVKFMAMSEKITLDVNPETVSYIINLARELYAREEISVADQDPLDTKKDWELEALSERKVDPVYLELRNAIEDLEPDQQVQLVALTWLGRGSFSNWDSAFEEARDNWNSNSANYLIGTPLLPDYLEEGLNQIGYFGEDIEI